MSPRVVVLRSRWGARYGLGDYRPRLSLRVVAHHTLAPALPASATIEQEVAAMLSMERFHVVENGWDGIGYNWVVFQSGRIYEGRGWEYVGAHAGGAVNGISQGIAFVIDGSETLPSLEATFSCRWLIQQGVKNWHISPDYILSGHRDHMERECPGDRMYPMIQQLRHDAGFVPDVTMATVDPTMDLDVKVISKPTPQHVDRVLSLGAIDPTIAELGLRAAEIFLRGILRGKEAGLKEGADALADWLKSRRST